MSETGKRAIYKCADCKTYLEVLFKDCDCQMVCCGKPMELLIPQTADFKTEKHVPYIERQQDGVLIKVGKETPHPMTEEHYIVYIEICADGVLMRKYLKPGDAPEAFFKTNAKTIVAWDLCNIHKLWKSNQ